MMIFHGVPTSSCLSEPLTGRPITANLIGKRRIQAPTTSASTDSNRKVVNQTLGKARDPPPRRVEQPFDQSRFFRSAVRRRPLVTNQGRVDLRGATCYGACFKDAESVWLACHNVARTCGRSVTDMALILHRRNVQCKLFCIVIRGIIGLCNTSQIVCIVNVDRSGGPASSLGGWLAGSKLPFWQAGPRSSDAACPFGGPCLDSESVPAAAENSSSRRNLFIYR